jgi:hypothetical protein
VFHTLTAFEFKSAVPSVYYQDKSLLLVDIHIELDKGLLAPATERIPQRVQRHHCH